MKIAVVGCGAVGGFYGARLGNSGQELHFLLRSDFDVVSQQGVRIHSPWGDFEHRPRCWRAPEEIGICDLVLIALKTTANRLFAPLLTPLVGRSTLILTLQNGLGNEEALARLFPSEQILGGLCFVCLNRTEPGRIHHIDHGRIVLGEHGRIPTERTHAIAELLRKAGIPCEVTDDLGRSHWEKLAWNIPFNGLGVASAGGWDALAKGGSLPDRPLGECLTTDRLLADPLWEKRVREVMEDVIRGARAIGYPVPDGLSDRHLERTRTMGAYKASTLVDFERGRPLELESLFLEPKRRAEAAGASVPRLSELCEALTCLTSHRDSHTGLLPEGPRG